MERFKPSAILRDFIKEFVFIRSETEMTNRILPDTSMALAFRYRGEVEYCGEKAQQLQRAIISGLRKSVRLIHYAPVTENAIILFKEGGASVFFDVPLGELYEESIDLENFVDDNELSMINEQLCESENNSMRVKILERFVLARLCIHKTDAVVSNAIHLIHKSNGLIKIKSLANALCISQDPLEKRFRKIVGSTPKQFASIIRMRAVVNALSTTHSQSQLAFDAGYYDVAHFAKEFKVFTGLTPGIFFKSDRYW